MKDHETTHPSRPQGIRKDAEGRSALHEEYRRLAQDLRAVPATVLMLVGIVGIAIILASRSALLDLAGLLAFAYALSAYAYREGHREGYLESRSPREEVAGPEEPLA